VRLYARPACNCQRPAQCIVQVQFHPFGGSGGSVGDVVDARAGLLHHLHVVDVHVIDGDRVAQAFIERKAFDAGLVRPEFFRRVRGVVDGRLEYIEAARADAAAGADVPLVLGRKLVLQRQLGRDMRPVFFLPARACRVDFDAVALDAALTITVALAGRSSTLDAHGQRFDFIAGHSTVAAFASVRGERRFASSHPTRQLRLIAQAPLLHKYGLAHLTRDVPPGQTTRLACTRTSAATQHLSETVLHLHHHGGTLLELQIAALSLLAEQTRGWRRLPQPVFNHPPLRAPDQEKIHRARDILMAQYDRPLTLAYLCMQAGVNETKLKHGFRTLFGVSVHRMLTDIRMQKAWQLLETGLHAATVAYRVGYRHPASFSAAFAQYYGRTPKSVARK